MLIETQTQECKTNCYKPTIGRAMQNSGANSSAVGCRLNEERGADFLPGRTDATATRMATMWLKMA
jgi:hypothetical protein